MQTRTMSSDQARQAWGELIDVILAGETVKILRHGRPVAVVISPKLYERFQQDHMELLECIRAGDPANDTPWEQVQTEMIERGQLDEILDPVRS
jgi:prevent-host-death family protein